MKRVIYLIIIIFASTSSINAAEKRDCSGLKKLSKAFITCKSVNFKTGVVNTGSKVKKGTVTKAKKIKKSLNNPFKKKN